MTARTSHSGAALLACAAGLALTAGAAPRVAASTTPPGGTFGASWISANLAESIVFATCASRREGNGAMLAAKATQIRVVPLDPLADARLAYLAGTNVPYRAATLRIGSDLYHLTDVTLDDAGAPGAPLAGRSARGPASSFIIHAASIDATGPQAPPEPQTADIVSGAATAAPVSRAAPTPAPMLALTGIGTLDVTVPPRFDASGDSFSTTVGGASGSRLIPACFGGRTIDGGAYVGAGTRRSFPALRVIEIAEHAGTPFAAYGGAPPAPSMVVRFAVVARPKPSPSPSP